LALEVLGRTAPRADLDRILALIDERAVEVLVVGIPIRADGSEGKIARDARFFAAKLADARPSLRVAYHDEAYSTVEAHDRLGQRHMDTRQQRKVVDAVAAQVILEDWLAERLAEWLAERQGR
jgi:putative holliday junction resolvase